jgi:hypothetical protein
VASRCEPTLGSLLIPWRHIERGNAINVFARYPQHLPACHEDRSGRTQTHDRLRHAGARIADVLATVKNQEASPLPDGPGCPVLAIVLLAMAWRYYSAGIALRRSV